MGYNNLTTDELIEIIVSKIGVPLPMIDYNHSRKYVTAVPMNVPVEGGGVTGVEYKEHHDTFRNACLEIIRWYNNSFTDNGVKIKPLKRLDAVAIMNFLTWKSKQSCDNRGGVIMYDIKGHHKFLDENEVFEFWKKQNNYS